MTCKLGKNVGCHLLKDVSLLDTVLEVEPCSLLWKLLSGVYELKSAVCQNILSQLTSGFGAQRLNNLTTGSVLLDQMAQIMTIKQVFSQRLWHSKRFIQCFTDASFIMGSFLEFYNCFKRICDVKCNASNISAKNHRRDTCGKWEWGQYVILSGCTRIYKKNLTNICVNLLILRESSITL